MSTNKPIAVKITTTELDQITTVIRSCLTAENSLLKLRKFEKAGEVAHLRKWAEDYRDIVSCEMQVF